MNGRTIAGVVAGVLACTTAAAWWYAERGSPEARHRQIVRLHLNDPDSAVFRGAVPATRGGTGIWCGEVNARNRMGGMVGFTRYVAELPEPGLDDNDSDRRLFSRVTFDDDSDAFSAKWHLMCE